MVSELLKAFVIGICASAPLGPVAMLVMQKTLKFGRIGGFATSQGASVVDTSYATLSLLALGLVQDFLDNHQIIVMFVGGALILLVGAFMLKGIPPKPTTPKQHFLPSEAPDIGWGFMGQALASGLSNPGAILVHFTLFSFFGIEVAGLVPTLSIIAMVFLGTEFYWFFFTLLISKGREKFSMGTVRYLIMISGYVVIGFGLAFVTNGIKILLTS